MRIWFMVRLERSLLVRILEIGILFLVYSFINFSRAHISFPGSFFKLDVLKLQLATWTRN